jgi:hypothetical protein
MACRIAFRPRRFARPRRFSPPIARLSPGFSSPFTVRKDSRACCISLPIVGFAVFLPSRRVEPAPGARPLLAVFLAGHYDCGFPQRSSYPPEDSPRLQLDVLPHLSDVSVRIGSRHRAPCLLGLCVSPDPRPSRRSRCRSRPCGRIERTWSPEALLRWRVCTSTHRIRACVGLPSLGLVPLRGLLRSHSFRSGRRR